MTSNDPKITAPAASLDADLRSGMAKKLDLITQNRQHQVELANLANDLFKKGASIEKVIDMLHW